MIDVTKEIDISKRCYFYVKYSIFSDNIPFSTIREDLLGYINTSQKIENIPEVAFSLLQGEILNYKNDKLNIIKIFNSDIKNKEKNFGVLKNYFGIQEKV